MTTEVTNLAKRLDNFTLKQWLRDVGSVRRKEILQKIKGELEGLGLPKTKLRHGLRYGLIQLMTECSVLVEKLPPNHSIGYSSRSKGSLETSEKMNIGSEIDVTDDEISTEDETYITEDETYITEDEISSTEDGTEKEETPSPKKSSILPDENLVSETILVDKLEVPAETNLSTSKESPSRESPSLEIHFPSPTEQNTYLPAENVKDFCENLLSNENLEPGQSLKESRKPYSIDQLANSELQKVSSNKRTSLKKLCPLTEIQKSVKPKERDRKKYHFFAKGASKLSKKSPSTEQKSLTSMITSPERHSNIICSEKENFKSCSQISSSRKSPSASDPPTRSVTESQDCGRVALPVKINLGAIMTSDLRKEIESTQKLSDDSEAPQLRNAEEAKCTTEESVEEENKSLRNQENKRKINKLEETDASPIKRQKFNTKKKQLKLIFRELFGDDEEREEKMMQQDSNSFGQKRRKMNSRDSCDSGTYCNEASPMTVLNYSKDLDPTEILSPDSTGIECRGKEMDLEIKEESSNLQCEVSHLPTFPGIHSKKEMSPEKDLYLDLEENSEEKSLAGTVSETSEDALPDSSTCISDDELTINECTQNDSTVSEPSEKSKSGTLPNDLLNDALYKTNISKDQDHSYIFSVDDMNILLNIFNDNSLTFDETPFRATAPVPEKPPILENPPDPVNLSVPDDPSDDLPINLSVSKSAPVSENKPSVSNEKLEASKESQKPDPETQTKRKSKSKDRPFADKEDDEVEIVMEKVPLMAKSAKLASESAEDQGETSVPIKTRVNSPVQVQQPRLRVKNPSELGCERWCPTPANHQIPAVNPGILLRERQINPISMPEPISISRNPIQSLKFLTQEIPSNPPPSYLASLNRNLQSSSPREVVNIALAAVQKLIFLINPLTAPNSGPQLSHYYNCLINILQDIASDTTALRLCYKNRPLGLCSPDLLRYNLVLSQKLFTLSKFLQVTFDEKTILYILKSYHQLTRIPILNLDELRYIMSLHFSEQNFRNIQCRSSILPVPQAQHPEHIQHVYPNRLFLPSANRPATTSNPNVQRFIQQQQMVSNQRTNAVNCLLTEKQRIILKAQIESYNILHMKMKLLLAANQRELERVNRFRANNVETFSTERSSTFQQKDSGGESLEKNGGKGLPNLNQSSTIVFRKKSTNLPSQVNKEAGGNLIISDSLSSTPVLKLVNNRQNSAFTTNLTSMSSNSSHNSTSMFPMNSSPSTTPVFSKSAPKFPVFNRSGNVSTVSSGETITGRSDNSTVICSGAKSSVVPATGGSSIRTNGGATASIFANNASFGISSSTISVVSTDNKLPTISTNNNSSTVSTGRELASGFKGIGVSTGSSVAALITDSTVTAIATGSRVTVISTVPTSSTSTVSTITTASTASTSMTASGKSSTATSAVSSSFNSSSSTAQRPVPEFMLNQNRSIITSLSQSNKLLMRNKSSAAVQPKVSSALKVQDIMKIQQALRTQNALQNQNSLMNRNSLTNPSSLMNQNSLMSQNTLMNPNAKLSQNDTTNPRTNDQSVVKNRSESENQDVLKKQSDQSNVLPDENAFNPKETPDENILKNQDDGKDQNKGQKRDVSKNQNETVNTSRDKCELKQNEEHGSVSILEKNSEVEVIEETEFRSMPSLSPDPVLENLIPVSKDCRQNVTPVLEKSQKSVICLLEKAEKNCNSTLEKPEKSSASVLEKTEKSLSPVIEKSQKGLASIFEKSQKCSVLEKSEKDSTATLQKFQNDSPSTSEKSQVSASLLEKSEKSSSLVLEKSETGSALVLEKPGKSSILLVEKSQKDLKPVLEKSEKHSDPVLEKSEKSSIHVVEKSGKSSLMILKKTEYSSVSIEERTLMSNPLFKNGQKSLCFVSKESQKSSTPIAESRKTSNPAESPGKASTSVAEGSERNSSQVSTSKKTEVSEVLTIDSSEDEEEFFCFRCKKISTVVCARCEKAHYCSKSCQEMHWETNHYKICQPKDDSR